MNKYDKYIVKSEGVWNTPFINSQFLNLKINGYKPKFEGGCMAIIPLDDKYVLLGEDDDHYFDQCVFNKENLIDFRDILESLSKGIIVKIDYVKCESKQLYNISKSYFFDKNYSIGNFKVTLNDRTPSSPLVIINNSDINLNLSFDVFHAVDKLKVIRDVLKIKK